MCEVAFLNMSNNYNLIKLINLLRNELDCAKFLQSYKIIPENVMCKKKHDMKLALKGEVVKWYCSPCKKYISARKANWFETSKLPLKTIILFIYSWSTEQRSIKYCERELEISHTTAVDYNNFMREVCASTLSNQPRSIGGEGKTVEIDYTYFTKRKNEEGKLVPDQWVFGGICRETEEVFLCTVPETTEDAITECIKNNIEPGTTIFSDCHPSYKNIGSIQGYNYKHLMVNNGENVVDPALNANIQSIENIWFILNERIKKLYGVNRKMLDSYLSEFVWRRRYANEDLFCNILKDIASCYPPKISPSLLGCKPSNSGKQKGKKRKRNNEKSSKSKGCKPGNTGEEKEKKRKRNDEESSKSKKRKCSPEKNQTKDVKIAEIDSSSPVKVVCHISPEGLLQTLDDNDNQSTISGRLRSRKKSSSNILGRTEHDHLRPSSDDESMRMEGCVNEMFGKTVTTRLNEMSGNDAVQLRPKIEELIQNFRVQMSDVKENDVSISAPPLCDEDVSDIKEIIDDVLEQVNI